MQDDKHMHKECHECKSIRNHLFTLPHACGIPHVADGNEKRNAQRNKQSPPRPNLVNPEMNVVMQRHHCLSRDVREQCKDNASDSRKKRRGADPKNKAKETPRKHVTDIGTPESLHRLGDGDNGSDPGQLLLKHALYSVFQREGRKRTVAAGSDEADAHFSEFHRKIHEFDTALV